jgi:glycosyltransferase involved in cell wall biosynthesis
LKRQIYIVNNSLRDRRGHYFETSLAIAEAARDAGLRPIVGAHVECPPDLFPAWLECYPLFTTDHWMIDGPAEPADLVGLAASCPRLSRITIQQVARGDQTVHDYLQDRLAGIATVSSPQRFTRHRLRRIVRRLIRDSESVAHRLLPEFGYDLLRSVYRSIRVCFQAGRHVRRWLRLSPTPERRQAEDARLKGSDSEYSQLFQRDLACLLRLTDAQPDYIVLLGTAHGRELLAIHELVRCAPHEYPTFHLEFRHPILRGDPRDPAVRHSPEALRCAEYFHFYRRTGESPRIRFHTDTNELSAEYGGISGLEFGVLPIPFRTRFVDTSAPHAPHAPDEPLTLTFLGDARDEKGFHWFPELIESLRHDPARGTKIRFRLQATPGNPRFNPRSTAALRELQRADPEFVQLLGLDGPLTDSEYYRLLSASHIVLLPYERFRYASASSGTLTEAIAAGKPTVVPDSTWMSAQQPQGSGATFTDIRSFIAGVRHVIDDYDECRRRAQKAAGDWRRRHSPRALVDALLSATDSPTSRNSTAA